MSAFTICSTHIPFLMFVIDAESRTEKSPNVFCTFLLSLFCRYFWRVFWICEPIKAQYLGDYCSFSRYQWRGPLWSVIFELYQANFKRKLWRHNRFAKVFTQTTTRMVPIKIELTIWFESINYSLQKLMSSKSKFWITHLRTSGTLN